MVSTARHRKTLCIFVSHSITAAVSGNMGLLSPWTRQNSAALCLMRCNNAHLVKQAYEEFVSLVAASGSGEKDAEARSESAFWQFAHAFNQHTMGVLKGKQYEMSHEGIFILASGGLLDTSVKTWFKGYEPDKRRKRARVEDAEDNLSDPE